MSQGLRVPRGSVVANSVVTVLPTIMALAVAGLDLAGLGQRLALAAALAAARHRHLLANRVHEQRGALHVHRAEIGIGLAVLNAVFQLGFDRSEFGLGLGKRLCFRGLMRSANRLGFERCRSASLVTQWTAHRFLGFREPGRSTRFAGIGWA